MKGSTPGEAMAPEVIAPRLSEHQMPQLDSLRAFAVLAVLCVHFVSRPPRWLTAVPWAAFGVELFFVLSGFLITGILLDGRAHKAEKVGRFWTLRQFYMRRFLRICPLYYAVIVIGYFTQLEGFTETFGWNLAYLTNIYIVLKRAWIGAASHLWTLSVEEQFYLIWPLLVLFVRGRYLLPTFIGVLLFAIAYRVAAFPWLGDWLNITPVASFDCFGAGSLLALAHRQARRGDQRLRNALRSIGLALGIPVLIVALTFHLSGLSVLGRLTTVNVAMTLLFLPLISGAAMGFKGVAGMLLMLTPLRYLGRISYGIYIYHLPVAWIIGHSKWIDRVPHHVPHAAIMFVTTLLLSAVSWHLYENPINRLKRRFPYKLAHPDRETHRIEETQERIP